ncbi:ABC transporter permease subunit [Methylogaea oryzae]|uniref:Phosphate ABC transporter permease n=1 Tax=Methylogaea oryzae TaxID=1295382 RepID=A0A8D5AL56_9GAMM|nr:ABC transporter permease subunit [Methylogaea oryzae]BBL69825.1 phosphate ABC transporter permease [Methylogaea oryzae]
MSQNNAVTPRSLLPDEKTMTRRRRRRMMVDTLVSHAMAIGGGAVIMAVLLIFFYLLYEVAPLFKGAESEAAAEFAVPAANAGATLTYVIDEQTEVALRYTDTGHVILFQPNSGKILNESTLPIPAGVTIASFAKGAGAVLAFGLSDGSVIVAKQKFSVTFPDDHRTITPDLAYPLGQQPLRLLQAKQPVRALAAQAGSDGAIIVGWGGGADLDLLRFQKGESFLDDDASLKEERATLSVQLEQPKYLLLDSDMHNLYAADEAGLLAQYDVTDLEHTKLKQQLPLLHQGQKLTALTHLTGDISLLVGDSDGGLAQWFPVRNEHGYPELKKIRAFDALTRSVSVIIAEEGRKGFLAADGAGRMGIYHTTAHRTLLQTEVGQAAVSSAALAPRANAVVLEDAAGIVHFQRIHNEHPEVSWSSLWGKVWYESYPAPDYVWQSSSSGNDFEPKFSLVPLSFGTLKAAVYALLVAVPLAIFGAIYTAYFMAPTLRQTVKPMVEIMGALPSVILGFLAGLWLAPALERNLPGVFLMVVLIPLGTTAFAFFWQRLPERLASKVPNGWLPLLLVPVVFLLGWISFAMSYPIEQWLFGGDVRNWLVNVMHISYDQRNAIVVGFAMGFAVMPTIFSIAEDAVFDVPKHLTYGSLALGATPWQTMIRVVLLTASPGIFSAVMIGMGRAVGETMIVLMATGNTPVVDFSLFQGMRTLAANIAVEMPESAVGGTHFRVLILAALVLFAFTFLFNTIAELVRHRLRQKYSSL